MLSNTCRISEGLNYFFPPEASETNLNPEFRLPYSVECAVVEQKLVLIESYSRLVRFLDI